MSRRYWHWAVLILGLLMVVGLMRLHFDVDVLNLLPKDLTVVQGLELYQRHFTDSRELMLTVKAAEAVKTEAAARELATALRARTNLVASVIWQPAWLEHPAQAADLIAYLWLNEPPSIFGELTNRLTGTNVAATLADAREQLATSMSPQDLARRGYDPYDLMNLPENVTAGTASTFGGGQSLFASADGRFRILFVKARPELSNYQQCIAWMREMKNALAEIQRSGAVSKEAVIGYTGGPAFTAEISSGMQHDMTSSIGITSVIIAILFWFFHRRWIPMLWLLVLLAVILACTLAFGGLLFGTVNVVSLGFAGILLGLAVDYGVVHYQEAMASPNAIIPEIRRAIGPSIFWAAVTTISAFLVLNFGGLPGLAQLGSLVALGVALSALMMLFAFLPPLFRDRMKKRLEQIASGKIPTPPTERETAQPVGRLRGRLVFGTTILLLVVAVIVLSSGVPKMDHSADALRPQNSAAYAALDEIRTKLAQNHEPLWLITRGHDELEVAKNLAGAAPVLVRAESNRVISSFTLPTPVWPRPDYQAANRAAAETLIAQRNTLRSAALDNGFSTNSLVMTDHILDAWQAHIAARTFSWPTNELTQWVLEKVAAKSTNEFFAVAFVFPNTNAPATMTRFSGLFQELSQHGFILSGWDLLGSAILNRVQQNLWKVLLPMVVLVLLSLWFAFRRPTEILLSLSVLCLSGLVLLTVMRLAGWSWNLLNLMALPLMLGSGVDYSIFMQLALRRHHGNLAGAHHSVGRALLLCGGTAVAGFGSLSWSTNAGMASLGEVCAIGIASNMLISVLLLPVWWRKLVGTGIKNNKLEIKDASETGPSALYRSELWRVGLGITKRLSPKTSARISGLLAAIYWKVARTRREIVIQNLLPPLKGDRAAAEKKGRALLQQFALKVADLWRYESGLPVDDLFGEWTGWDYFVRAQEEERGILLLTPHLGNWEFGGPLLTKRGVNLQVITLAEPGNGFTELRRASRARWDIETLVIGQDPFGIVEIIRRLEAGATVALLMDRPPVTSQVMVELFGRPFAASLAAAELARASGCVLLPVYLPMTNHGYAAHILPPVPYDRGMLRKREARQQLTQQIMRAFEPAILQYLDQWYHFVPVWPTA